MGGEALMARTYYTQILSWDWEQIVVLSGLNAAGHTYTEPCLNDGCDKDGHTGAAYLGSVMALTPSGKFYMPWTTNQTNDDVDRDSRWFEALEKAATKYGGYVEHGDGDPTDLFFYRYWTNEELA
jgi:hypothetical protein